MGVSVRFDVKEHRVADYGHSNDIWCKIYSSEHLRQCSSFPYHFGSQWWMRGRAAHIFCPSLNVGSTSHFDAVAIITTDNIVDNIYERVDVFVVVFLNVFNFFFSSLRFAQAITRFHSFTYRRILYYVCMCINEYETKRNR